MKKKAIAATLAVSLITGCATPHTIEDCERNYKLDYIIKALT